MRLGSPLLAALLGGMCFAPSLAATAAEPAPPAAVPPSTDTNRLPPLFDRLRLPAIGAPLFIVSNPDLVIAQCKAGIVGSFPALNARPQSLLDEWLHRIEEELAAWDRDHPEAPAHLGVRALLEHLPSHPISRRLRFVDPLSPEIRALAEIAVPAER